ncbi:type II secretion system F family protein [Comamonas sp. GB3 AK4-5]|uniref:type II secretion system F family protein n=1 Tax=Comamonas sp. GB3 AK4-5 TaxID=3231487 RepID=UPI00351F47A8
MATAARPHSSSGKRTASKERLFAWEGKDRSGKLVRGEMRAASALLVHSSLRRQGIGGLRIQQRRMPAGKRIRPRDIALFTRQMASMLKAGVPLLQAFDIVGSGHHNPRVSQLLLEIRSDVETGTSLSAAFRKHPLYFNALYCNLIEAGETAGILEALLDRLASYMEKTERIKLQIRSALMYPCTVLAVALVVVSVIMVWVIPAFKEVFSSFGADLPAPTLLVMAVSDTVVRWWWQLCAGLVATVYGLRLAWKRSERLQQHMDRLLLKLPLLGPLLQQSCVARWTRTLSTMFAAGVPLVEALGSVGGASGNHVYHSATQRIQQEVATGTSLSTAMGHTQVFPHMVLQMAAIGEESGTLDHMLGKAADYFEQEVDERVAGLSSLMEPLIIVFLGTLIGGIVVSMYLPIFKLGQVV